MTIAIISNICATAVTHKAVFCVGLKWIIKQYPGERPLLMIRIEIWTVNHNGFKTFGVIEAEANSGQHTFWVAELQGTRMCIKNFNFFCNMIQLTRQPRITLLLNAFSMSLSWKINGARMSWTSTHYRAMLHPLTGYGGLVSLGVMLCWARLAVILWLV